MTAPAVLHELVEKFEQHRKNETELRQRKIESTDAAIDALVYRLYGLTEEELGIVEQR